MNELPWFKFYGRDYLTDPKISGLTVEERQCWVVLMCLASCEGRDGHIRSLSEDDLMRRAGIEPGGEGWRDTIGVLEKFASEEYGMVTLVTLQNVTGRYSVTLKHFAERQTQKSSSAERVKRYRERQKLEMGGCNDVTLPSRKIQIQIDQEQGVGVALGGNDKRGESEGGEEENPFRVESKFEQLWGRYPSRTGRKEAERHYRSSVRTVEDEAAIEVALTNYLGSGNVKRGYVKNGSTWFNNWRDWVEPTEFMMRGRANGTGAVANSRPSDFSDEKEARWG